MPHDGMYMIPGMAGDEKAQAERYAAGPVALIAYRAQNGPMMAPEMFIRGILIDLLVACIVSILLGMTDLRGYLPKVIFVSLIGLALGLFTNLNNWNWMVQSFHYTAVDVIDTWIAWTLGGAVLGKSS